MYKFGLLPVLLAMLLLASCSTTNTGNLPNPNTDNTDPVIGAVGGVTDGATVSGTVTISATATDDRAVTQFSLEIDGTEVANATSGSLSFDWDTTAATNAAHALLFTARDAAGNIDTLTIAVTVNNVAGPDVTDPVITGITGVTEGGTVSGNVQIDATATDNLAVTSFTLSIDGTQVDSESDGSLSFAWDTTAATNASHVLLFTAADAAGNDVSQTINVTVDNTVTPGPATVSGVVYMPNGSDPVSGALIYVEDNSGTSAVGDPPTDPYLAFTYSDPDGSFLMEDVPTGSQEITIQKGAFRKTLIYVVEDGANTLSSDQTTLPSEGGGGGFIDEMLVVTGDYDSIENVLAKLGLGEVDGLGLLILGTEQFDLVDAANKLDDTYQDFDEFFADETNFANYRTIFLNCGNQFEAEFFADTDAVAALKAWLEAGGRLYCTDWSYDFAEQLWPERVDFASFTAGNGFSDTPETPDEAQCGAEFETLECTFQDDSLKEWMASVGAVTAGATTFPTIDWLPAWAAIEDVDDEVKVWATGDVTYGFLEPQTSGIRPVTISFEEGSGVVLFSSYHTEETASTELNAQERVLQYLIFELL